MIVSRIKIEYTTGLILEVDDTFEKWTENSLDTSATFKQYFEVFSTSFPGMNLKDQVENGGIHFMILEPLFETKLGGPLITYIQPEQNLLDTELELALYPLEENSLSVEWDQEIPDEVFDSITDFLLICGPDFTIKKANDAAISVFGSSEDIVGKKCYNVLRDQSAPCEDCPLPQTLAQRKVVPNEHYDTQLGEYMETRTYPQVSGADKLKSFTLVTRMVSHRREQEVETTQNKKLQALGQMASGIAHDFNNMLTIILGRLQLLKQGISDTKLSSNLKTIEKAALDSTEIIQRLQEFTRQPEQESEGAMVILDMNEVVSDVVDYARTRIERAKKHRGVHIEIETQIADVAKIEGNKADLRNALLNLIFNAVDALDVGGLITIWTDQASTSVEVGISDTGVGMSPETIERIFDPFFTTKGEKGNGLGLSEVYGIINQHNGTIDVDSTLGEGTTFTIRFPKFIEETAS
ncbi:MAG: hypothetical protein K9N46_12200 [Candidatus Marinimicrobia bacterium]|nr:hypothetical protein [Candidatus Neomarinimicrobiota bacterium]MCF7829109.1 hypothetical protein [Candidatus Neomarinimicrobiota bacterium]MCF7881492.1 hypothetical protein [Candidatus Neomarinimicrobiota bacterium]